jgi:SRSO17 transposase
LAIPPFAVVPSDGAGFMEALWALQAMFHDCLARSAPRAPCCASRVGQCSQRARKAIEPMALHVEGGTIRGLPRFLRAVRGDEAQMLWHDQPRVAAAMGDPAGVLLFDETGFGKKGQHSVGVARPYCGPLGKVAPGQGGGFAGYASRHG